MKKILIVEDEPMLREMARTILESSGYQILEAASGKEALDAKELQDIVYAVGNGQSLSSAQASATPVVGISGVFWINTTTTSAQNWNANSNWSNGTGFPNSPLAGANVTDLSPRFDTSPYLSPHSDIVALMVLEHQSLAHNLLTRADYSTRRALFEEQELNRELKRGAE